MQIKLVTNTIKAGGMSNPRWCLSAAVVYASRSIVKQLAGKLVQANVKG